MARRTATAAAACAVIYVAMWVGYVQGWPWLTAVDDGILRVFHNFGAAHPTWVDAWDWFCTMLSPAVFRILALIPIFWLLTIRRQPRTALFLFLTIEVSGVLTEAAKQLADRPRPSTALVYASGTSFPSGHALGVLVCVLALLAVALPAVSANWRVPLAVLGAVIVVAIGVGRVVLNVHHPSDVVAGWALGYLYFLLCLPVLRPTAGKPAVPDTAR